MNIHKNARLTPKGREQMVKAMLAGQPLFRAAQNAGVSQTTARKWLKRYKAGGQTALYDKSSRPDTLHKPTPRAKVKRIIAYRKQRLTGKHIAKLLNVSRATVSRVLRRAKLSRAKDLEPKEPVRRYERDTPGELIHLDIKKLNRFWRPGHRVTGSRKGKCAGAGWEYAHVCIDDHSRVSYTDIFPDEKADSAVDHLKAAVAWYKILGIKVERVMTDNGSCYISKKFAKACKDLSLRHIRTKPYTPKTNGKAERFIQSAIREWAYGRKYQTSDERAQALPFWQHMYNWHRPHGGIKDKTPISRLNLNHNNLLRLHN